MSICVKFWLPHIVSHDGVKSDCNSGKIYPFYPAIRVVSCGVQAVVRFGLRGTTLERVGDIAGVSKGVVLHHFKDKSALLEAVFAFKFCLVSP